MKPIEKAIIVGKWFTYTIAAGFGILWLIAMAINEPLR